MTMDSKHSSLVLNPRRLCLLEIKKAFHFISQKMNF